MATHFARGIINEKHLMSVRLSTAVHNMARQLPEHRRTRFLASRALLSELMFMLYGASELPPLTTLADGRPVFSDPNLPRFSLAYAGNIVGIALTTTGECGLDMELQRLASHLHTQHDADRYPFSRNETLWINNQNDPTEARTQLYTLRQSVLKLMGNATHDSPNILQLLPGSGRLRASNLMPIEAICDAEDVLIWSVAVSPAVETLQLWEYDSRSGWHNLPDVQTRTSEEECRVMRFTSLPVEKALMLN